MERQREAEGNLMNRPEHPTTSTKLNNQVDEAPSKIAQAASTTKSVSLPSSPRQANRFDWLALGVVILIAALFAMAARLNAQPPSSFVPVTVLSATGCGLLVTALRKLRTTRGAGILVAGLGGFFMALLQFIVAITYPGVFDTLTPGGTLRDDFLITWGLITGFSILFSIAGAAVGHLAFAPPRPLPARSSPKVRRIEEANNDASPEEQPVEYTSLDEEATGESSRSVGTRFIAPAFGVELPPNPPAVSDTPDTPDTPDTIDTTPVLPSRSVFSYLVPILLLGLAPTVVGYVFSAAYDYTLSLNQLIPGPYPTLRLLSTLLPWQVPLAIDVSGNIGSVIIFSLLWRIPLFLGNPTPFDIQSLQPYVFNAAALGLLLLTMHPQSTRTSRQSTPLSWRVYLLLEAALGLLLVLPANLWVLQGLQGLLQIHQFVIPIRTLAILNPLTFSLNLITGPLVCIAIGIVLRRFLYPRTKTSLTA